MAEVGSAFVSILPSAKGFGSKLESEVSGEVGKSGSRIGGVFGGALKAGALVGGAALLGLGAGFKSALGAAAESEKITAQTAAVLKSTGGVANVTADSVKNLGNEVSAYSGIADETVREGQNMLLTFTKVRNEVGKGNDIFTQATKLTADMSVALGTDLKGSALQVGKALNDPTKGVTALSRAGVSFTQQQKDQIATLQESGDTLGAQKIILSELETQFGGAAKAAGDTFSGSIEKLKNAFGDTLRDAVAPLLPKLTEFATILAARLPGALSVVIDGIKSLAKFLAPVAASVGAVFASFSLGEGASSGFFDSLKSIALVIGAEFLPVLQQAADAFTSQILPALISLGQAIVSTFKPILIDLGNTFVSTIVPALAKFYSFVIANIVPAFVSLVAVVRDDVLPIVGAFAAFVVGTLIPTVISIVQAVGTRLRPVFDALVTSFRSNVLPALQLALAKFKEYQPTIQKVIVVVAKVIGKVLEFAAAILSRVLPPLIKLSGFIFSKTVPAIAGFIDITGRIIGKVIEFGGAVVDRVQDVAKFVSGLKQKFDEAIGFAKSIPGRVLDGLGSLATVLFNAGVELIQGLINGITSKIGDVKNKMGEIGSAIGGFLPGSPVKEGPLKSWNRGNGVSGAGFKLAEGLAKGLSDGKKKVVEKAKSVVDGIRSQFDRLKNDMKSLSASIADAFRPDLFAGSLADLFNTGRAGVGDLRAVTKAFKKLRGFGLSEQFLSDLYASGNTGLILDLASGDRKTAESAQSLFDRSNKLASSLGSSVSGNQFGDDIKKVGDRLEAAIDKLRDAIKKQPKENGREVGRAINGAAVRGRRDARSAA